MTKDTEKAKILKVLFGSFFYLEKPDKASLSLLAEPGEMKHYVWQRKNLGAHQPIRHTQGQGTSQDASLSAEGDGQYHHEPARYQ